MIMNAHPFTIYKTASSARAAGVWGRRISGHVGEALGDLSPLFEESERHRTRNLARAAAQAAPSRSTSAIKTSGRA